MIFQFNNIITPEHTQLVPYTQTYQLAYGIIIKADIIFPPGCFGNVHVRIQHGLNQIIPSNSSGTISGNGAIITGETFIALLDDPYELKLTGYSVNCSYNHNISVLFWIKRLWQLNPFSDQMFKISSDQEESPGI